MNKEEKLKGVFSYRPRRFVPPPKVLDSVACRSRRHRLYIGSCTGACAFCVEYRSPHYCVRTSSSTFEKLEREVCSCDGCSLQSINVYQGLHYALNAGGEKRKRNVFDRRSEGESRRPLWSRSVPRTLGRRCGCRSCIRPRCTRLDSRPALCRSQNDSSAASHIQQRLSQLKSQMETLHSLDVSLRSYEQGTEDMRKRCHDDRSRPHCEGTVVLYRLKVGTPVGGGILAGSKSSSSLRSIPPTTTNALRCFSLCSILLYCRSAARCEGRRRLFDPIAEMMNASRVAWATSDYPNFPSRW